MDRYPYQMTSTEFNKVFPFFAELPPRTKWRLYRINNKINLEETCEECSYAEFADFAKEFRWDTSGDPRWEGMVLTADNHASFVVEALHDNCDVPSDVLAEYPDMIEEFITKRVASKKTQQKRQERFAREREEKAYVKRVSKEDRDFWSNF